MVYLEETMPYSFHSSQKTSLKLDESPIPRKNSQLLLARSVDSSQSQKTMIDQTERSQKPESSRSRYRMLSPRVRLLSIMMLQIWSVLMLRTSLMEENGLWLSEQVAQYPSMDFNAKEEDLFLQTGLSRGDAVWVDRPMHKSAPFRQDWLIQPRVFTRWSHGSLPCLDAGADWRHDSSPTSNGLLYTKCFKTGSSTGAGIHLRIARNEAKRQERQTPICKARFGHTMAHKQFAQRKRDLSFLWSLVRDPVDRLVSFFFHMKVSRRHIAPTYKNFVNFLGEEFAGNQKKLNSSDSTYSHYAERLSVQSLKDFGQDPLQFLQNVMEEYDFIGVAEVRTIATNFAGQAIRQYSHNHVMLSLQLSAWMNPQWHFQCFWEFHLVMCCTCLQRATAASMPEATMENVITWYQPKKLHQCESYSNLPLFWRWWNGTERSINLWMRAWTWQLTTWAKICSGQILQSSRMPWSVAKKSV